MSLPIFQIKRRNKNTNEESSTNQKLNGLIEGELGYNYYDNGLWIGPQGSSDGKEYSILINEDHKIVDSVWINGTSLGPQLSLYQQDERSGDRTQIDTGTIPVATETQSGIITIGDQSIKGNKTFVDGIVSTNIIHGNDKETLYNIIETYILNIDYTPLQFDTSEIVIGNASSGATSSILGQGVLGYMILG